MAKQVLDYRASAGITTNQSNEHQRRWSEQNWEQQCKKGNYDRSRAHLNFEIVKGGKIQAVDTRKSIPQRMRENLKKRGIADPNLDLEAKGRKPNRRTMVNFIFGGSRDRMLELAFGDQKINTEKGADNSGLERKPQIEEWALDIYNFCCNKWGEDNIVGFYVHLDEKNPHIHCSLLPIDKNNRFSFRKLFCGEQNTKEEFAAMSRQLHDEFAAVNEKWGLGRGDDVHVTKAKHRSTEEYRRDLLRENNSLEESIASKKMTLRQLEFEIKKAETRCKGLHTMIENLSAEHAKLTNELAELNAILAGSPTNEREIADRIVKVKSELQLIESKLSDKREKLDKADQQLADLLRRVDESKKGHSKMENRTRELREVARSSALDVSEQVHMRVAEAAFDMFASDARVRVASMSPMERLLPENEFIVDLADSSGDVMKCAVCLFVGYIDGATQIAEGGGGGSSSDLKWGRDEDEDDRLFAMRCMKQAKAMLKKSGGSVRRR